MRYATYAAGFVGKTGGDIQLMTVDREEALLWTKDHTSPGKLAVMRGYDQQALDWGADYMNSVLVNEVIGFDGLYTKGYQYQISIGHAA